MDEFIIITWPDIQDLMDLDDFEYNACLIDDYSFVSQFGSSAYFVNKEWLNENLKSNL